MKKIVAFGIILVVLLAVLTGCSNDPESTPESMTFVDNVANPGQEFTINENLEFSVRFLIIDELLEGLFVEKNDVVSGRVAGASGTWTNTPLTGTALGMSSNNDFLNDILPTIEVGISLTYSIIGGEITSVLVAFTYDDENEEEAALAGIAEMLMGGNFIRIER